MRHRDDLRHASAGSLEVRSPLRRWCVRTPVKRSGLDETTPHRRRREKGEYLSNGFITCSASPSPKIAHSLTPSWPRRPTARRDRRGHREERGRHLPSFCASDESLLTPRDTALTRHALNGHVEE